MCATLLELVFILLLFQLYLHWCVWGVCACLLFLFVFCSDRFHSKRLLYLDRYAIFLLCAFNISQQYKRRIPTTTMHVKSSYIQYTQAQTHAQCNNRWIIKFQTKKRRRKSFYFQLNILLRHYFCWSAESHKCLDIFFRFFG